MPLPTSTERAQHDICIDVGEADGGTDDIHDGVRGTHFVKVDLLDAYAVDLRFRRPDGLEHRRRQALHIRREARTFDDALDSCQIARRTIAVGAQPHRRLGAADAHLGARFQYELELLGQLKPGEFGAEMVGWHADIHQRSQVHVAGDAGEALVEQGALGQVRA